MTGWLNAGSSSECVWGHYQGSARTPYAVVIDLHTPQRKTCSCPGRRLPCKHVVALLGLLHQGGLPNQPPPPYAQAWLDRRSELPEPSTARAGTEPADPEAAAQRAAARVARVTSGLEELDRWLADQVRGGLAGIERAGYAHFESVAARMVDAQAPGVASVLRSVPGELVGEGWPARVLDRLAGLHLLVAAHRRLGELDDGLAATVRSRIGYPVSKSDVLEAPGVADEWFALGMVDSVEYRLETRRVWLWGQQTQRWAILLSFAPPGGTLASEVVAGQRMRATLHFYPGSGQHRALVGQRFSARNDPNAPTPESFAEVQTRFAELIGADPWADRLPAAVSMTPLQPQQAGRPWRLRDPDGLVVDLIGGEDPWALVACAARQDVGVFGEWSARGFRPLSLLPGAHGSDLCTDLFSRAA